MQEYNKIDQYLHSLCQYIAVINKAYVPAKEDDSHTNLYFDNIGNRIVGRWINSQRGKVLLALNLETLALEVLDEKLVLLLSINTLNKTKNRLTHDLEQALKGLHLEVSDFSGASFGLIGSKDVLSNKTVESLDLDGLDRWKHYRELANTVCLQFLGFTQKWEEIRIWPHNFDTGVHVSISPRLSLGFGLAMKDKIVDSPYFYLSAYTPHHKMSYEALPLSDSWEWKTDGEWKGVILPLNAIDGLNPMGQLNSTRRFIFENTKWFLSYESY